MTDTITRTLAAYAAELRFEDLPGPVVARSKALILDFLGSVVRARVASDSTPALLTMLRDMGLDAPGPCAVPGTELRFQPPVAALVTGMLGHSLDFDDTHAASSLHPSAPVVSAALAVGQARGASGAEVLTAIIAGFEICCRLGLALDPARHYARGFHPTATAGTFGAAAAAARLMGCDGAGVAAALGVAGSQAAGSLQFLENGAWNKRWQVGQAAMNGVLAGALAASGFHAARAPIEGKAGFLHGYTDGADPDRAIRGLGQDYETMRIGVKPYPACRYTHAALDGLKALREDGLDPAAIRRVTIGLHRNGITLTADPIDAKRRARSVVEGQFSMPFTAAVMLLQGSFGWDDYARLGAPEIEAMAERVDVVRDPGLEGGAHPFGATVQVDTDTGTRHVRIDDPSGEPESFPDNLALLEKFFTLAEPVLGPDTGAFADAVLELHKRTDLRALQNGPA